LTAVKDLRFRPRVLESSKITAAHSSVTFGGVPVMNPWSRLQMGLPRRAKQGIVLPYE
jgi:hypothetical protein